MSWDRGQALLARWFISYVGKWNGILRIKREQKINSRRKVQSAKILGKDEQGLGDMITFSFVSHFETGEIKEAWRKEQRNYFANEWTDMNKKVINAMKMIVCSS